MNIVLCPRCSQPCRISDRESNPNARPLRLAKTVKNGYCPNCAITHFIQTTETLAAGIARNGAKALLLPHIQKGFEAMFIAGDSDADISEIDWQSVVENWDLPFPKKGKKEAKG